MKNIRDSISRYILAMRKDLYFANIYEVEEKYGIDWMRDGVYLASRDEVENTITIDDEEIGRDIRVVHRIIKDAVGEIMQYDRWDT